MLEAGRQALAQFFELVETGIDLEAIWRSYQALRSPYDVTRRRPPLPVWARRSFSENGMQAWEAVQREAAQADPHRGMSVYVHIPFCAEKCSFCDCYSFRLRSNHAQQASVYREALVKEVRLWSRTGRLSELRVSTVHFGGGTPLFIGEQDFSQIVAVISRTLNVGPETEWALETTSSALEDTGLDLLEGLDFKRIHVGVQSLEDPLRRLLKRSEPAQVVLEKIRRTVKRGGIVSVDLIYGLPHQSPQSLLNDVRALAANGVDGFSLYPLQISSRNQAILKEYGSQGKNLLHEYWMLQAAEQVLNTLGYRKTLFNHYAREKDTNLYFTFPERDEDCLALGTIADGVCGSYHYRHPEYRAYLNGVSEDFPGLQGGLRRTPLEERVKPLEVMILAGRLRRDAFDQILGWQQAEASFRQWLDTALIDPGEKGEYRLTASGSWFAGEMIGELPGKV